MNMTVVIVRTSRQMGPAMEFLLVALASLCLMVAAAAQDQPATTSTSSHEIKLKAVKDESRALDDHLLSSIVEDLGETLEDDMEAQMARLAHEINSAARSDSKRSVSEAELARLREVNKATSQDIKARVAMAGDRDGALPQWSLGNKANSFLSATSQRLTAASSYVGNKLRSMGASVAGKIPARLKRFFRWPSFMSFKVRHHKRYASVREELYRQMVYLRSHVSVGMQHLRFLLRRDKHLLGATQYADMTADEIYEALNNEDLEAEFKEMSAEGPTASERAQLAAQLQKLAASKRDIFGQEVAASSRKSSAGSARRRRKRAASDEEDELDAEEEEDVDLEGLGVDLGAGGDSNETEAEAELDDEEASRLVDEFAFADLGALDEIDSNLDEALNNGGAGGADQAASTFEPIDLRETKCFIRPENQNLCGNCYSQAVTATAAYYQCRGPNGGEVVRYHPFFTSTCGQYLTPVGKSQWINGCNGGRLSAAVKFQTMVGLPRFGDYNCARVSAQVSDSDKCAYPRPETGGVETHSWPIKLHPIEHFQNARYTLLTMDEVDLHLRTVGPVLVNIRTWLDFEKYDQGVYDKKEDAPKPNLHSMVIVGHFMEPIDHYVILNSAGIVWGERGYLRVSRESLEYFLIMLVGLPPNNL